METIHIPLIPAVNTSVEAIHVLMPTTSCKKSSPTSCDDNETDGQSPVQQFVRRFEHGQIIFNQGDESTEMYQIRSGKVRVLVGDKNMKQLKQVAVLCKESIFGELANFSPSKRRTATCVAEGTTVLSLVGRSGKPPVVFPTSQSTCAPASNVFNGKELEYNSGSTIIEENDMGSCFYVILAGKVDVFVSKQLVNTMFAGEIFGESAIGANKKRTATCIARTKVSLLKMEIPKLSEQKEKNNMMSSTTLHEIDRMKLLLATLASRRRNAHYLTSVKRRVLEKMVQSKQISCEFEGLKTLDNLNSLDTLDSVESLEALGTMETLGTVETLSSVEPQEAPIKRDQLLLQLQKDEDFNSSYYQKIYNKRASLQKFVQQEAEINMLRAKCLSTTLKMNAMKQKLIYRNMENMELKKELKRLTLFSCVAKNELNAMDNYVEQLGRKEFEVCGNIDASRDYVLYDVFRTKKSSRPSLSMALAPIQRERTHTDNGKGGSNKTNCFRFNEILKFRTHVASLLGVGENLLPTLPRKVWGATASKSLKVVQERETGIKQFFDAMLCIASINKTVERLLTDFLEGKRCMSKETQQLK